MLRHTPHANTSIETFTIADGADIAEGTIVGLHVDLGEAWTSTDGSRRSGYMTLENPELDCDVVIIVASPVKAFPHYMEDEPGSLEILKKHASGDSGSGSSFFYPTAGGGAIEMLSELRAESERSRIAVAREFGAIDSAIFVDFGCQTDGDIEELFRREFVAKAPAFVTD